MTHYPLLFRCERLVVGKGYVARVDVRGRLVAHCQDDGFWISGVEPGDVSAGGKTLNEAFTGIQDSLGGILEDIALEPASFEEFQSEVEVFFSSRDLEEERLWREAVERVRTNPDDVRFLSLKHRSADDPRGVTVTQILPSAASPRDNASSYPPALAA
jgi:predicted RNase H-like HicB family nuclease